MRRKGRGATSPAIPSLGPSSDAAGGASLEKRLERLERELQAATARLEQSQRSGSMQLDDVTARVDQAVELAVAQSEQQRGAGERLEAMLAQTVVSLREDQARQREEWSETVRRLMAHIEQLELRLERVDARATAQTGRHLSELAQLHQDFAGVARRMERLGKRVNALMDEVTADVDGRIDLLAQRLEAARDNEADDRLVELDRFATRLAELETHQTQLAILAAALEARRQPMLPAPGTQAAGGKVVDLNSRRRDSTTTPPPGDAARAMDVVDLRDPPTQVEAELAALARDQDWLRQELAGVGARVDDLSGRLDRTERLARSAGKAMARLLRTLRATNGSAPRRR